MLSESVEEYLKYELLSFSDDCRVYLSTLPVALARMVEADRETLMQRIIDIFGANFFGIKLSHVEGEIDRQSLRELENFLLNSDSEMLTAFLPNAILTV